MADNIEHLMLEQFRRLGTKVERLLDAVKYIHNQQLADHHLIRSLQTSLDGSNELLTPLTARVAHIERRLKLTGDPVPTGLSEP
jgi:hypothetical protein